MTAPLNETGRRAQSECQRPRRLSLERTRGRLGERERIGQLMPLRRIMLKEAECALGELLGQRAPDLARGHVVSHEGEPIARPLGRAPVIEFESPVRHPAHFADVQRTVERLGETNDSRRMRGVGPRFFVDSANTRFDPARHHSRTLLPPVTTAPALTEIEEEELARQFCHSLVQYVCHRKFGTTHAPLSGVVRERTDPYEAVLAVSARNRFGAHARAPRQAPRPPCCLASAARKTRRARATRDWSPSPR